MPDLVERVARAICEADPYAPDPDAHIYINMLPGGRAWEARIPQAEAAIAAMRNYEKRQVPDVLRPRKRDIQLG